MFELRRLFCKRDGEKKADCSSSNFILLENHITIRNCMSVFKPSDND